MTTLPVNVRRKLGLVERGIFGGFVEHLGRCIYGGIFDEGSPLSDARVPHRRARRSQGR